MDISAGDDAIRSSSPRSGNDVDFAAFYLEVSPRLYRYALTHCNGDKDRAKDMVQKTMVKLWCAWPTRERWFGKRVAYAMKAISNMAVDMSRSRAQKQEVPVGAARELDQFLGDGYPLDDDLSEHGAAAVRAMLKLPRRLRDAVFLVCYEGYSRTETAELMGVSVNAVYNYLNRGLTQLRTSLERIDNTATYVREGRHGQ
ncbi:RNA polymerase sigma factor [Sphaerisporangium sp. TRM90804]|uniref:RNA polymerase sigma factor n=1 Tax=Sphaerisporangium sp. TRM90804 TaxID=3031113 RepID=UPI002446811A|nr:RNA polymerase sigma factor [Sphaerisporangium sp. TRM90804]MDH2424504.1 RNA polymerase sigma factor [Sphaerisporangium sp. TRM90804]